MLKTTLWRPDTCECEIEYQWDDKDDQESRAHTVTKSVKRCEFHKDKTNKEAHYQAVLGENRNKNITLSNILKTIPSVAKDIVLEDGSTGKALKNGIKYNWSFDADRKLVVDLEGASHQEKQQASGLANSKNN